LNCSKRAFQQTYNIQGIFQSINNIEKGLMTLFPEPDSSGLTTYEIRSVLERYSCGYEYGERKVRWI
jgi:hypothetical protein